MIKLKTLLLADGTEINNIYYPERFDDLMIALDEQETIRFLTKKGTAWKYQLFKNTDILEVTIDEEYEENSLCPVIERGIAVFCMIDDNQGITVRQKLDLANSYCSAYFSRILMPYKLYDESNMIARLIGIIDEYLSRTNLDNPKITPEDILHKCIPVAISLACFVRERLDKDIDDTLLRGNFIKAYKAFISFLKEQQKNL